MTEAKVRNIREFGWRQGSVLSQELTKRLRDDALIPDIGEDEGYFVISQDCDVVNRSLDAEPTCEILRFTLVETKEALLENGRNPRRIQFSLGDSKIFECSIHDKRHIPRIFLGDFRPSSELTLTPPIIRMIKIWIAKRYSRQSFPDTFNDRYRSILEKIKKQLKSNGDFFDSIYLTIDSLEELGEEESYEIEIVASVYTHIEEGSSEYIKAETCIAKIGELLESCSGIDVIDYRLETKETITLADLETLRPWDVWDYLSVS